MFNWFLNATLRRVWATIMPFLNPLTINIPHHIETSQVICSALYDGEQWLLMG